MSVEGGCGDILEIASTVYRAAAERFMSTTVPAFPLRQSETRKRVTATPIDAFKCDNYDIYIASAVS